MRQTVAAAQKHFCPIKTCAATRNVRFCRSMKYAVGICPAAGTAVVAAQPLCLAGAVTGGLGQAALPTPGTPGQVTRPTADTTADKPSQTQSHLVKPSPTINFRGAGPRTSKIRVIRGRNPPICAHLCASVAATQYGLIRPNTALIIFENCRVWPVKTRNLAKFARQSVKLTGGALGLSLFPCP